MENNQINDEHEVIEIVKEERVEGRGKGRERGRDVYI
jgi:hypothetical protein